jgi:hypothetical protein
MPNRPASSFPAQALIVAGLLALMVVVTPAAENSPDRVPVLLELFTSEGCSSCPPADRLLESLDKAQPFTNANLIVLSEHVDYWDNLGWKDPYSSAAMTARQHDYGRRFGLEGVYTPQLVVDGQYELVGSNSAQAKAAITKASRGEKALVTVSAGAPAVNQIPLRVSAALPPGAAKPASVLVAIAEAHAQSKVLRGENSGRSLTHVAAVRSLVSIGTVTPKAPFAKEVNLPVPKGASGSLRFIAFVQEDSTGRVLGAAQQEQ